MIKEILVGGATCIAAGVVIGIALAELMQDKKSKKSVSRVNVGDLVQWESMGSFVFTTPRKVDRIVDGEWGFYVFVEDSTVGIPIEQVVVVRSKH
jgi:hypothetical protein